MTRRNMLGAAGAAAFLSAGSASPQPAPAQALPGFGGAPAGFPVHSRAARGGGKPFDMVEHCHDLGLGVVETRLSSTDPQAIKALRRRIESYGMRLILDVGYPRDEAGLPAFDAGVKAAKDSGAISLRAAMTGRRYWLTFDDSFSPLPGRDLAHTLELAHRNKPKTPLPKTTGLNLEAQLQLEDECVAKSLDYIRRNLV